MKQFQIRAQIAREAARVMVEGASEDYQLAKRKAAERLGIGDPRVLPANFEIEEARQEYLRLFRADTQPEHLQRLRRVALEAMRFLARFEPRLVGPVLAGTADEHSEVVLHLFADTSEEVMMYLLEHGIRFEDGERRVRVSPSEVERLPAFGFLADDVPIELVVFTGRSRRRPALSPVDGRPMERAALARVEALVQDAG